MAIIKCPECEHSVSDSALVCPGCGVNIAGNIIQCPDCGKTLLKSSKSCPSCGWINNASSFSNQNDSGASIQEKKSNKVIIITIVVVALIVLVGGAYAFFANYQSEQQEQTMYNDLQGDTTIEDYQAFLDKYPESEHAKDVEARMNMLKAEQNDWISISLSSSKSDFINFLSKHKGSPYEDACKTKIDSLSWIEASNLNTPDAYARYLSDFPEGKYVSDAQNCQLNVEKMQLSQSEKQSISQVFSTYFTALGNNDEGGVCSEINTTLDKFLGKVGVAKSDVVAFMRKIHQNVSSMSFNVNNDYKINKVPVGDGEFAYDVKFSVDQHTLKDEVDNIVSYRISAKISPNFKITELNMTKVAPVSSAN